MKGELVNFKGVREGIYIFIRKGNFQHIKNELEEKLKESINFYEGANILGIKGESLSKDEISELLQIMGHKYNLHISEDGLPSYLKEPEFFKDIDEGVTKFINTTIRSGQVIEYTGNIVVLGDVNPGALVKANGNIIILGTLRGVAHAGYDGNREAIVAAHDLRPTQLRIADIIGRRPDGEETVICGLPEVAKVKNGEVLIEPYLLKK